MNSTGFFSDKRLVSLILAMVVALTSGLPGVSRSVYVGADKYFTYRTGERIRSSLRGYKIKTKKHSTIYFTGKDNDYAEATARIIDTYAPLLASDFALSETPNVTLIIYPDKATMYDSVGYNKNYSPETPLPIGAYSGGILAILSPDAYWETKKMDIETFISAYPVIHELAHLMLDKKTKGNYTEWFAEGTALYYENRYLGKEPTRPPVSRPISLSALSNGFKYLDEEAACRKSYEIVKFIAKYYGAASLKIIYEGLESGESLTGTLKLLLGNSYAALDKL